MYLKPVYGGFILDAMVLDLVQKWQPKKVMSPEKEKHRAKYQIEETKTPHQCLLVLLILLPVICRYH